MSVKAVFMDRDGIINELVYYPEQGVVDSPFVPEQMKLTSFAAQAVNRFHALGFNVFVASNQPGMAKGHFDEHTFEAISLRMRDMLKTGNAFLDGEYYCFHHPNGVRERYTQVCDCRKPSPGMLFRAAEEHDISLAKSYFVGDGIIDIKAGHAAKCKTVLVASANGLLLKLLEENAAYPDYLVRTLEEAVGAIECSELT